MLKKKSKPKSRDVAFRLMAMRFAIGWANSAPPRQMLPEIMGKLTEDEQRKFSLDVATRRDKTVAYLKELGIWRSLSPKEQAVMESTLLSMTHQQKIDATWAVEAAQTLMWAVNLLPSLSAQGTLADPEFLNRIASADLDAFARSLALRADSEVEQARSVAEFWHWRSRIRELIERGDRFPATDKTRAIGIASYEDVIRIAAHRGAANGDLPPCVENDFAANGKAYRDLSPEEWSRVRSQSIERHRALNWLCGYAKGNAWDETPIGT